MTVARYLDVVVVAVLAVPLIIVGAPAFGVIVGVCAWVLQRLLQIGDRRLVNKLQEPRQQLTANLFESFGRIWLLAGAIIIAGLVGSRADGLTAALVIFGAYSIAFVIRVITGPPRPAAKP